MTPSLSDPPKLRSGKRLMQKLIQLFLLMVIPALCWIGVAGLVGRWRLPGDDATAYGFMLQVVAVLLLFSAFCMAMLRVQCGPRWLWVVLVLAALLGTHFEVSTQPSLLGASHAFVNVATGLVLLGLVLVFCMRPFSNDRWTAADSWLILWIAIVGTGVSVSGAYLMVERDLRQVHGYAKARAIFVQHSLQAGLDEPVLAVQRMTQRWNVLDMPPGQAYIKQEFHSHISGIEAIQRFSVIEANGQLGADHGDGVHFSDALEQAQRVMAFWAFLDRVKGQDRALMSPPGLVPEHPQLVFVAARIGKGYPDNGWLVATVDLRVLVKDAFLDDTPPCCFAVNVNHIEFYRSADNMNVPSLARASTVFDFEKNFNVEVTFWKDRLPGEIGLSYYPLLVLLTGLLFTFFMLVSVRLAQVSTLRARLLFDQSRCDPLTGLPNRRVLEENLEQLCQPASQGRRHRVGLMFIDLRGVRLINDSLGHEIADQLMLALTARLRAILPPQALLARLDGGEFVVTLTDFDATYLTRLAETLVREISAPLVVKERELSVSAVIGMSSADTPLSDPMQLVREADLAMIHAKSGGQSAWAYYEPALGEASALQLILSQELTAALHAGQLSMAYQPLICTQTGQIVAMEALVRWTHPERGPISPAQFIPMAEESGQIVELTDWTLAQVCADIQSVFSDCEGMKVPVGVNISPVYFQREDALQRIQAVLSSTGVANQQLQLEMTEGLLLRNQSDAMDKILALREMGIVTSLDDFGTGYSSLSYLKNLPIQKIKLDRSFVHNVTDSRPDAEIVRGVISIAHQLALQVVVEGVETVEQARCLKDLHADQLQGYVFSKPIAAQAMRMLINNPAAFKDVLG